MLNLSDSQHKHFSTRSLWPKLRSIHQSMAVFARFLQSTFPLTKNLNKAIKFPIPTTPTLVSTSTIQFNGRNRDRRATRKKNEKRDHVCLCTERVDWQSLTDWGLSSRASKRVRAALPSGDSARVTAVVPHPEVGHRQDQLNQALFKCASSLNQTAFCLKLTYFYKIYDLTILLPFTFDRQRWRREATTIIAAINLPSVKRFCWENALIITEDRWHRNL